MLLCVVGCFSFCSSSPPLYARGSLFFGVGYRNDCQGFNFANAEVDPASELEWKRVQAVEFELEPEWCWGEYRISLDALIGVVYDGLFIDSDWRFSGRQGLFSRSLNHVEGNNYDLTLRYTVDLPYLPCVRYATGFAYHQQYYSHWGYLIDLALDQVIWSGKTSAYHSEWFTGWLGFEFERTIALSWSFACSIRGHLGGYRSWGDWRLRDGLRPGRSWKHVAPAFGLEGEGRFSFWTRRDLAATLSIRGSHFWTGEGGGYFYTVEGGRLGVRLNESYWDSIAATVGFNWSF